MADDEITLLVGGYIGQQLSPTSNVVHYDIGPAQALSGWQSLRVTRGIERFPNDFEITMTEKFPGAEDVVIQPGDYCTLLIGDDTVVTGYIDRVLTSINANMHEIRVTGRGKCQDLLDCSAQWPGGQMSNCTVLDIATNLAGPYNIEVMSNLTGLPIIPQQNIMLGETAYEIIERTARYSGVLVFEDQYGELQLTRAGNVPMSSGVQEGVNLESASVERSMDQRYSEIMAVMIGTNNLLDLNAVNSPIYTATDPNVKRHRRRVIVAEAGELGWNVGVQRANWEVARRLGRSEVVHVVVDNWRAIDGELWHPNALIDILIPSLKVSGDESGAVPIRYLISEVTLHRDMSGTHAELTLMAPEAFMPQPVLIQPQYADVISTVPQQ